MAKNDSIGGAKQKAKENARARLTDHEIALVAELVEKAGWRRAAKRFEAPR
jgi:hypothetical protein